MSLPLPIDEAAPEPPRPEQQVHRDMMFLAGELLHRGAQTHLERRAAEFLRDRFREYTLDVEVDDFHAIENPTYLFGSYFGEFVVVGFFALLGWPAFALAYGAGVLISFLAEFHGLRLFGRWLPEYETQNVVARFLSLRPRKLIVVAAHYDSGGASPLSDPGVIPYLRFGLRAMLTCMVVIVATCGAEAWAQMHGAEAALWIVYLRWAMIGVLMLGAAFMFYASRQVEDIRGANGNASGVAALLYLAERFKAEGVDGVDLWLAATGSHEAWMSGVRRILRQAKRTGQKVYFLNIESVGAGKLSYTTKEGMLLAQPCGKAMVTAAAAHAADFGVRRAEVRAVPTGAHLPLASGCEAMSIVGLDEDGVPAYWNQINDRIMEVDDANIVHAAKYAEAVIRDLAKN